MPKNVYPSMDTAGFINDDKQIATRLINDWYGTNHSQTIIFTSTIKSAAHLAKEWGHDPGNFVMFAKEELRGLFDAYLYGVNVNVDYRYFDENDDSRYEVLINISFHVNGVVTTLSTALIANRDVLERLMELTWR